METVDTQFQRVERRALADGIIEQIVEKLLRGALAPGDRLPTETELGGQLGVSRSSVREALKGLEILGLVTRTNAGTFVSSSSPAESMSRFFQADLVARRLEVADVYEARRTLEVELTVLSLRHVTDEDVQSLRALAEAMASTPLGDHETYMAFDRQFHHAICNLSGNVILVTMWDIAFNVFAGLRKSVPLSAEFRELSDERHRLLVAALEARDPDTVRRTVEGSLEVGERNLIRSLEGVA